MPASVSISSVLSSTQVMCRRIGRCMIPAAPNARQLISIGLVLCGIPQAPHAPAFGVERNEGDVSLGRSDHAPAPFVVNDRDPVAS